ncbi:MAG TPA: hypothetical protein VIR00_17710 [Micromonosporaceae bacterium]|jgi:hypothetical protein
MTSADRDAYDDAQMILGVALAGDHGAVSKGLDDVVSRAGIAGAYHVAVCLAATMVGDDFLGGAFPGGAALEYPGIDEASYDARWVARFVSAYVNADRPTGEALFGAAVADGQVAACMATLAGSTLETLRRRID